MERREVGADRQRVDPGERSPRRAALSEIAFPESGESVEVTPISAHGSWRVPPGVGDVSFEFVDRARERDHQKSVSRSQSFRVFPSVIPSEARNLSLDK
jgi:hypothetical protein